MNEIDQLREQAQARFEELCRYLLPGGKKVGQEWRCGSVNGEPGKSMGINLRRFVFSDFATGEVGYGPIDLWMLIRQVDFLTAQRQLADWLGSTAPIPEKSYRAPAPKQRILELPPIEVPSDEDIANLAEVRRLSRAAVKAAIMRGFLWAFSDRRNGRCWLWLDLQRKCALRRRIDGQPYQLADGSVTKSASCTGSVMNEPLGYEEAAPYGYFAVVEGAPDGLAVYAESFRSGKLDIAPIVMPCASAKFTPESLEALRGKRGRIFIDNDQAGKKATSIWLAQLKQAGIKADAYHFNGLTTVDGKPVKDLNDYYCLDAKLQPTNPRQRPMAFA